MKTYLSPDSLVHKLMKFSADVSIDEPMQLPLKQLNITKASYLSSLHLSAIDESSPSEEVNQSRPIRFASLPRENVGCVIGYRGHGKSSLMHELEDKLNSPSTGEMAVLVDILKLSAQKPLSSVKISNDPESVFSQAIRERLLQHVSMPSQIGENKWRQVEEMEIAAWMLAGSPDHSEIFKPELVTDLHRLSSQAWRLVRKKTDTSMTRSQRRSYLKICLSEGFEDKGQFALADTALAAMEVQHLLQFLITDRLLSRLYILLDNVDQLDPPHLQTGLLLAAKRIRMLSSDAVRFICAVRRENTVVYEDGPQAGTVRVGLVDTTLAFPAAKLSVSEAARFASTISRRIDFIQAIARKTDLMDAAYSEAVSQICSRYKIEHAKTLGENMLLPLCNFDYRVATDVFMDFTDGLLSLGVDLNTLKSEHMATLFSVWLAEFGVKYGILIADLISPEESPFQLTPGSVATPGRPPLAHLLLITLRNLEEGAAAVDDSGSGAPTIGSLVRELKDIGFSSREIDRQIEAQCQEKPRRVQAIETIDWKLFSDKAPLNTEERNKNDPSSKPLNGSRLNSQCRVRLSPAGNAMLTHLYSRVGYIWAKSWMVSSGNSSGLMYAYINSSEGARAAFVVQRIASMARNHLKWLGNVRSSEVWSRRGDIWLEVYRQKHGVKVGSESSWKLQVERVLHSAKAYYRRDASSVFGDVHASLIVIERAYEAGLAALAQHSQTLDTLIQTYENTIVSVTKRWSVSAKS